MEFQSLPGALKSIMQERGWSQVRLARELDKSQEWVSKICRGERDTPLGQAGRMLADIGLEVVIRPIGEKSDPVKRREFHDKIVKMAGGTIAGKAAGATFIPSPRTTPYHDPEYVRLLAERAARVNDETGAASEAAWAIRQAKNIGTACTTGGRELHSAASWYMRRAAYILRDNGKNDVAEKLAGDALANATKGHDLPQQAAARATLGMVAVARGNNHVAVEHALAGLRIPEITDDNRAWLNSTLGVALSRIPGQERKARAAIDKMLSVEDLSVFDRADTMGYSGLALHRVGASDNALAVLSKAVHLSIGHSSLLQSVYLADQVLVALAMGDASRAAALMGELSYFLPLTDSRRLDGKIGQILQASARWAHVSEVKRARDQLTPVART